MLLRTLALGATIALFGSTAAFAAPPDTMGTPMAGQMMNGATMNGQMGKHHGKHHRKHKRCRDANGKFMKCAPGMSGTMMSPGMTR